ncbi:MAG: tRNA 2-thiouridine(34) synthase MnmA [Chlamydiales bacterium]|nr:tRNA 2-thiouridine(34) synthase MnmA [Chlamydiales bacterium]
MNNKTVVVGMSGGVDSSVSALLLKQQGFNVIGLFMRNWEEEDDQGVCRAAEEYEDVKSVCRLLDIPHYAVNFSKDYWERVFSGFLEDLKAGFTPNPDVLCNREIKFDAFLDKAMSLGADYLATGHYCQNLLIDGRHHLGRGLDQGKDQSYFLYTIKEHKLQKTLFPVGGLEKSEVRRIATEHGLSTAGKKDSTGICFIGKRNFKQFINQYVAYSPGDFETLEGKVVGRHDGVAYYTIGQRKGLGIGGAGDAWFVVKKDVARNVIVLAQGSDHPALYHSGLLADEVSWVGDAPSMPLKCTAKVRYRQPDVPCTVESAGDGILKVVFDQPVKAITPKQSIVLYSGDICLGGAIISTAL